MPDDDRQAAPVITDRPSRSPGKGSLRRTLTLAMVLMAVVPALLGAWLLESRGRALIRDEVSRHMQSVVHGASLNVQHLIENHIDRADRFVHRPFLYRACQVLATGAADASLGASEARALLNQELADLALPGGRREGSAVIVSLSDGRPLAWTDGSFQAAAVAAAYHKANLSTGLRTPWLSPAHLDAGDNAPVVCLIQAVPQPHSASRRPPAVLIWSVALAPTIYAALDERTGLGKTGEIELVDHSGLVLKDLRYEPGSRFRNTLQTDPVKHALSGDEAAYVTRDYRGVPVVAAACGVPVTGWGLVAKMDLTEAYSGITRLTRLWVTLMVFFLLAGVLAARLLSRQLLRPVEALSAATRAVAEGDMDVRLDTGRTDELGQMARDYLDNLLDNAGGPIVVRDADDRIIRVNHAFERLTGRSQESLLGEPVSDLFPEAKRDQQMARIRAATEAERIGEPTEFPIRRLNGAVRSVLWSSAVVYGPDGETVVAVIAQGQDITERKAAEEALRQSEARLQAIIASSPAAVIIADWEGHVELYSPAAERMFGWTEAEVLGRKPPHVPPEKREEIGCLLKEVCDGCAVNAFETYRLRRDGSRVEVSLAMAPLLDADGQARRFLTVITDISERRRAEQEAEERRVAEHLLGVTERMLAETSPSALLQQLVEGAREMTEAQVAITGHGDETGAFRIGAVSRADGVPPCPPGEQFAVVQGGVYLDLIDRAASFRMSEEERTSHPRSQPLPPGHVPLRGLLGAALPVAAGESSGLLMLSDKAGGRDFTARDEAIVLELATLASLALQHLELSLKLSRQAVELETTNRELTAFSHSVSHDLRAPLRAIDGFSQALIEDYAGKLDERGLGYLDRLRANTQRMGELIDDLLQLSRVTRETMHWEEVDLSALAGQIATELAESEPARTVAWHIEPGLKATGHPRLLGVLLRNLLGNAFKFTSHIREAVIEFVSEPGEGNIIYVVKDNGAGFEMAYADKLFVPFQRLHSLAEFPGNGVGLAIVQRVVSRHGGKIWADSAVNHGATFRFTIGS